MASNKRQKKGRRRIIWNTLTHNGPVLPPPYKPLPSNVKLVYGHRRIKLNRSAEEVAGLYAKMINNKVVKNKRFKKNFFEDWRKTMTNKEKKIITDLKKCDFRGIVRYYRQQEEKNKKMNKTMKHKIKRQNEKLKQNMIKRYGFCVIDGRKQKIGNFKVEPPGLFCGRGKNPKIGKLKPRILPKDIIINIGRRARAPAPPRGYGRKWKEVISDNTVTWLASWTDQITGSPRYIMLDASAKLKSDKDREKYEKARKLKKCLNQIRRKYRRDLKSNEMDRRQCAVATYLIETLALRPGNEISRGKRAETFGCCSLRVRHLILRRKYGKYLVDFNFLGKDSIRYKNSVSVLKEVFDNLKDFKKNKKSNEQLFDRISSADLNSYLNQLMAGLTAKVFRTCNASLTLQIQLKSLTKKGMTIEDKIRAYNRANREAAVLCNHQRAVPKTFTKQIKKLEQIIKDKEKQIIKVERAFKEANGKNKSKLRMKFNKIKTNLKKLKQKKKDKEDNKNIALNTSKMNYIDPRITVSWCRRWKVPIEKVYNKNLIQRFKWAVRGTSGSFRF